MEVRNASTGWLTLWLEPVGEDRWLRPGEQFRIRTDYGGDEPAFTVNVQTIDAERAPGIESIEVWIVHGGPYAEVTDDSGNAIGCGHQRPLDIDYAWPAHLAEFRERLRRERPETS